MIRSSLKFVGSNSIGSKRLTPNRLYAAVLLALSGPVYALPEGGEVVAGEATIDVNGNTMQVLQSSQRAILNFQHFDIDSDQTVNFQQPGADAVALNRVLGDRLSEIHGALNANGQVYLINPNGVLFGHGAELNVGSLVVTTLDIADQDFLAGRDAFSGNAEGRVENQGSIRAEDRVVLLAPEVVNRGDIQVPDGEVVMRSSRQALLHTAGSEIPILVDDPDLVGRVANEGSLQAGEVALVLDGSGSRDLYDSAIDNSGMVRAVRASGEGGEIHLLADTGVVNSGTLDASATQGAGGNVRLEADTINQSGTIRATAVGDGDGGQIELLADNAIAMHSGSTIDASADQAGDAGDVVVIAEKSTWFTGDAAIKARGGADSGDGGFVEVSGREFIQVVGEVDVGADHGDGGLWFIDPTDISIVEDGPGADFGGTFNGSNPADWTPSGSPNSASINVVTLHNTLTNNGNVRISTASSGTGQGNITFETSLDYNGLGGLRTLTLEADGTIIFDPGAFISDSDPLTAEGLNVIATAGTGFVLPDTSSIYAGTGKIDITALTGDVTFTGLGSSANAADAIRVTANTGRLINGGETTWNLVSNGANAGVILSGRDGIEDITIGNNNTSANGTYVDASSSAGDISVRGEAVLRIDQLSSAGLAAVHAAGELRVTDASVLGGDNFQFSSSSFVALPQSGITVPGMLTLLGPDVVTENYERTLTIGADHLDITVNAAGGNLQLNTAVDTLSITNGFSNTIIANDVDGLTLGTIAPVAGAIQVNSGAGTDLAVGSDIDLTAMTGALTLGAGRDLLVNASITDGSDITLSAPGSVIFSAAGAVDAGTGNVAITATSGNVALGSLSGGTMSVTAGGAITDANGAAANLSGTSATLTAGTAIGTLANALDTSVGSLNLSAANGGAFVANDQALTLAGLDITGDLAVALSAGDLTLTQANPAVGGSVSFAVEAGDLIVPDAGLTVAGNLTISADAVVDADTTVSLTAANADITLRSGAGIITSDFDALVLQILGGQTFEVQEADDLSLAQISNNGDVTVTTGGDLLIDDIHLGGDDATFVFNAGGALTHSGTLASDAGADNITLDFTSAAALNLNGSLRDSNSANDSTHNFSFSAGTDLVMATNAVVGAGDGEIDINAVSGNATITGLSTLSTAQNAVRVSASGGSIQSANPGAKDIDVPDGGFVLSAMGDISELLVESNFLDVVSTAGDITLSEEVSTSVLRLETPGTATITTGGQFSVDQSTSLLADHLVVNAGTDFRIADTGLVFAGDLTVDADTIRGGAGAVDSGTASSPLVLSATNADITLRDGSLDRVWETAFDQLVLNIAAGVGSFALEDADELVLTSVTTGGDAGFITNNGDLELASAPNVAGNLRLETVGAGDLVIADGGLTHGAELTVIADNIVDSDNDVILGATNADITLRDGAAARAWTTSFDQLALDIAGAGDFSLVDADGLTLNAVTTGGNVSLSTTSADLVLISAPIVGGNLSLATLGSGDVVIPDAGLTYTGDLTVVADNLRDANSTLTLAATIADITLRDGTPARNWNTSFAELTLDIGAGGGTFALTDSDGLILNAVTSSGNTSFTTSNADLTLTDAPVVAGNLSLVTTGSGDVVIPEAGLLHTGNLTVTADNLRDSDFDITLGASNADITLRDGATAQFWATSLDSLVLDIVGTGDFALTDADGLTLNAVSTGGSAAFTATAADLVLTSSPDIAGDLMLATETSGDLIIADDGLTHTGNVTIAADNLLSSGASVSLAATNADIALRGGDLPQSWNTTFEALVLDIAGTGDFLLTDTDGLVLTSATTGGNATFRSSNADLEITTTPMVAGELTLATVGSGDVVIPELGLVHSDILTVAADNLVSTGSAITLAATDADITLRGGDLPHAWNTSFDSLVLDIAGAGDFLLTDTDGLTLNAVNTGGNTTLRTTGADLVVAATPAVAGELTLATVDSGDVVIAEEGLAHSGELTIDADNLVSSATSVILAATNANITLRGGDLAQSWTTSFESLVLDIAGAGDFLLTDTDGLTLDSITTAGNASFRTTDADLVVATTPIVTGELGLATVGTGDVVMPAAGLSHTAELTIDADNLRNTGTELTLAATNAAITLRDGAGAQAWNTSFDTLSLSILGAGALSLTDADGLTLSSVTTGGSASFASTAADLVLDASPSVGGTLNLSTIGSGDVVIPDMGLDHAADLFVLADNLVSAGSVNLAAANANITLRDGATAQTWATRFDALVLDIAGGGDFALTDADDLTLASVATGGNASFTTTGGDLRVAASPQVAGDLTLATAGGGDLVIPDLGLAHNGTLTLTADSVRGDSDLAVNITATDLLATLVDQQTTTTWNTNTDRLEMSLAGGGTLNLASADSLLLDSLTSDGVVNLSAAGDLQVGEVTGAADMALTSGGNMTLANNTYNVDGLLSLTAADNLQLAMGGLTVADAMQLQAETLTAADGEPLVLAGVSADLTLAGDQALALSTRLSQLGLTYNTASDLTINNDRDLTLTRVDIPNVTTLGLSVNGTLTMPEVGLSASERITIDAVDLRDSDRNLVFTAPELAARLSGASGDHNWDITADSLDVLMRGQANLQIAAIDGLVLEDLNNDGQAVTVENGNFGVDLASGELVLAGNIQAADMSTDGVRTGVIDLAVAGGSLSTRGPVEIVSTNMVDQNVGTPGAAYGIRMRLTDTSAANRSITLGDATGAATIRAVGGDILLDTRQPGTDAAAERDLVRNAGSTIDIFDNPGDAVTGQVLRNDKPIAMESWQTVRAGRTLAIITDVAASLPDNVLDELDDLDGSTDIVKEVDKSGPQAAAQFEQVFGICDELDKKNRHRCRVDDALKAFLSHWLVGGEMPPKTEIR